MEVAVELVLFTVRNDRLQVLLTPRPDRAALPGGFVGPREAVEEAARRVLREQTGFGRAYIEQLYTFGDPGRHPSRRTVSVAYFALLRSDSGGLPPGARWTSAQSLPPLPFDHDIIIRTALARLRAKLSYSTVGFQLLPSAFTLTELQRLYEVILARPIDKRNFRKKLLTMGLLKPVPGRRASGPHRPAQLYAFRTRRLRFLDGQLV
jgi:8-oxo-dGTP diphosphatase